MKGWEPTPKQTEFLDATENEVLYGGAAGGGKTDALVVDALGLQFSPPLIEHPKYRAILFRRTYTELKEVIDRAIDRYATLRLNAEWNKTDKEFTFPSGARVELGYLEHDNDKLRYQSREFQYIGFEELTQWATDSGYVYLLSRLRGPADLPKLLRATCNPGGPGHDWVRERFRIDDAGHATSFVIEVDDPETGEVTDFTRRFIPARLGDNPHLGSEYKTNLLLMSEQEQKALLYGRWDIYDIKGSIYGPQIQAAYRDGRIDSLPIMPGIPVNTFWDLGYNDTTSIWYHQRVGLWNHFIDYSEARLQPPEFYAQILQQKGYVYGSHYMPHDAQQHDKSAKTYEELYKAAGVRPIVIVPRIEQLHVGIEMTRQAFATVRIDRERCKQGISALTAYRYKIEEKHNTLSRTPLHDWSSNGADAFRQFGQGYRPDSGWMAQVVPMAEQRQQRQGRNKAASVFGQKDWTV